MCEQMFSCWNTVPGLCLKKGKTCKCRISVYCVVRVPWITTRDQTQWVRPIQSLYTIGKTRSLFLVPPYMLTIVTHSNIKPRFIPLGYCTTSNPTIFALVLISAWETVVVQYLYPDSMHTWRCHGIMKCFLYCITIFFFMVLLGLKLIKTFVTCALKYPVVTTSDHCDIHIPGNSMIQLPGLMQTHNMTLIKLSSGCKAVQCVL